MKLCVQEGVCACRIVPVHIRTGRQLCMQEGGCVCVQEGGYLFRKATVCSGRRLCVQEGGCVFRKAAVCVCRKAVAEALAVCSSV